MLQSDVANTARNLRDEALALPLGEREELALDLLASLEPADPDWEDAWASELDRRLSEVRSGAVATVAWEDVKREVAARLVRR